ncbi:hypothetical protein POM88_028809 [Heracleum sosnowskyi]|uniref:Uncharacterized protein n=1 Tax=Heracleum sosnowskyi TaxID=360622 RepID=A0AAD8GWV3_9APIA|nr:hypothetical protein POM88_049437 [Heracleum sosnowskyi]KAK1372615.1 hypothetical protein POM88_028808 [Heracleum sosnowskyi]KAK1372616.1 hypothetical protein POM88_028809 [Heracleum sosnowskyi]
MDSDAITEAERLLEIAEKFLQSKDLTSERDFAVLAQETAPLLDGSDQILAISDVFLAAETKKVSNKTSPSSAPASDAVVSPPRPRGRPPKVADPAEGHIHLLVYNFWGDFVFEILVVCF